MKPADSLVSMRDVDKPTLLSYLDLAERIETGSVRADLRGRLAALLFYEPSTRTHFSFETAMKRLGGDTLSMSGTAGSSVSKGESFHDTIKTIAQYVDLIVIRSPHEGAARFAAEVSGLPVVNAGDGANQHPSQALLDLYSVRKTQGRLDGLSVGIMGDLKFGRTVHSLVHALADFGPRLTLISPSHIRMPAHITSELRGRGLDVTETDQAEPHLAHLDVLYVTRVQKERFADPEEYEKCRGSYTVTPDLLRGAKANLKVMHPLPRVDEISPAVDVLPEAYYFQQARNGVVVRQAIYLKLLGACA